MNRNHQGSLDMAQYRGKTAKSADDFNGRNYSPDWPSKVMF